MAVDLHTHSTASDGSVPPSELMGMAADLRLKAIALTDHDTIEGIPEAAAAAASLGIDLVPGVELSLEWDRGGLHMLALWLEPGPGPLQDRLANLQLSRADRNRRIVEHLQGMSLEITLEEVLAKGGAGSVGRPHIAAVLTERGYVNSMQQAFEEYLGAGRPAYFGRERLDPKEAIDLTLASGAVPVLCHPHTIGLDNSAEFAGLYEWLADAGLIGLECHYATYDRAARREMVKVAHSFGLIPAGGSDFHGAYKPENQLGTGTVGIGVPDEVYWELLAARPEIRT